MNFTPVRDPVTGRIDMVPVTRPEWGDYGRCEGVRNAIGHRRYDAMFPDDFDGSLSGVRDMHDATVVEITSLLAPHAPHDAVTALAKLWIDANRLVRDGVTELATVAFSAALDHADGCSGNTLCVVNITSVETILCMYCEHGEMICTPIAHWNDGGSFAIGEVDPSMIDDDMLDTEMQRRRWETTQAEITATRKHAECGAGVVQMDEFRARRTAAG